MIRSLLLPASRLAVVAVLGVVAFAFSSSRASAACGDYVTIRGHMTASHDANGSQPSKHVPNSPCRGLNCSPGPSAPLAPELPYSGPVSEVKACLTPWDELSDRQSRGLERLTSLLIGDADPFSIYHPPRA